MPGETVTPPSYGLFREATDPTSLSLSYDGTTIILPEIAESNLNPGGNGHIFVHVCVFGLRFLLFVCFVVVLLKKIKRSERRMTASILKQNPNT